MAEFSEQVREIGGTISTFSRDAILSDMDTIAPQYAALNTAAFNLQSPTSVSEAAGRLAAVDLLLFAHNQAREVVGFATYQQIQADSGTIMYQARGLLPAAQGCGFGRIFPRIAAAALQADFLMAKAQNPISIWSTMASGLFESVYPIKADFNTSREMSHALQATVEARGKQGEVDMNSGVHKASYVMGKLGDYAPALDHPDIAKIQRRLADLGVEALRGDAVYYGGKIIEKGYRHA